MIYHLLFFNEITNGKVINMKKWILTFIVLCSVCTNFSGCIYEESKISQPENPVDLSESSISQAEVPTELKEESNTSMDEYLTYDLPDTLMNGVYSEQLGYLGGNLFCPKGAGSFEALENIESAPYGWNSYGGVEMYYQLNNTFENGQLTFVSLPWNHSTYLVDAEVVDGCEVSAIIVLVNHDLYTAAEQSIQENQCSRFWYVFFMKEDSDISYAIYLNADFFSKEDTLALAQTVKFKNGVFDLKIQ